jgi:hypothetical protein
MRVQDMDEQLLNVLGLRSVDKDRANRWKRRSKDIRHYS